MLFFPEIEVRPVVTDIQWFMGLLVILQQQKDNSQLWNAGRVRALGPEVPLFDKAVVLDLWKSEASSDQVGYHGR